MVVLGWVAVFVLLAFGATGRECLLLAGSLIAAHRFWLCHMERAVPLDAWRVGVHCIGAGCAGLAASATLGVVLLAALLGWWQPSHDLPNVTLGLIVGVGAVLSALQPTAYRAISEAVFWFVVTLVVAGGLWLSLAGHNAETCAVSLAVVAWAAYKSWKLASDGSSFLQMTGRR